MEWSAFGRMVVNFKAEILVCLNKVAFDLCVLLVMTYGCEMRTLNAKILRKI